MGTKVLLRAYSHNVKTRTKRCEARCL